MTLSLGGHGQRSGRTLRLWLTLWSLVGLMAARAVDAWAEPVCDSALAPIENFALQYRARGNRCEGLFRTRVTTLGRDAELVSLTWGRLDFPWSADAEVSLRAPQAITSPLTVRGSSALPGVRYRLDAVVTPGAPFTWPVGEVPFHAGLRPRDLGVVAWAETDGPLIPVAVTSSGPIARDLWMIIRTKVPVTELAFRTLSRVDGLCAEPTPWTVYKDREIRAGHTVEAEVPALSREMCVEVDMRPQSALAPSAAIFHVRAVR